MLGDSGKAYSVPQWIDDMTGVLVQCTFANTPVVSPDNKKPRLAGFKVFSNCRFTSLPSWRSSAKLEWII